MFEFESYLTIRDRENQDGADMFLSSCLNLAGQGETLDGAAIYLGQDHEFRDRVILFINPAEETALLVSCAGGQTQRLDHEDAEILGQYDWATSLA